MKIVNSEVMASIDSRSISEFGIPGELLMENAGIRCWQKIEEFILLNQLGDINISIVAGPGNNGGDALVVAREAWVSGFRNLKIILSKENGNKLFSLHINICRKYGIPVVSYEPGNSEVISTIRESGIIVDGLTGTGIRGSLKGNISDLAALINKSMGHTFSIDIPSGLGEGFRADFPAVKADTTLTLGLPKSVLYNPVSRIFAGNIVLVRIGFPPELLENPADCGEIYSDSEPDIPVIEPWAYKGSRGHLFVFAGSGNTSGAAVLAASSAGRSGTGLVSLFSDGDTYSITASRLISVMVKLLDTTRTKIDFKGCTAILAGPGWGRKKRGSLMKMILESGLPGVMDADALYLISSLQRVENSRGFLGGRWVLTPHPGEFEELSGVCRDEFLASPLSALQEAAASYGAVIVLKGHVTFIVEPGGEYSIVDGMTPSLGTGGSGDILSGIIAGFLSRGMAPYRAAVEGVILHQKIGKECFKDKGWYLAEDLLPYISRAAAGQEE